MPMLNEDELDWRHYVFRQEVRPFTDKQMHWSKTSPPRRLSPSRTRDCSTSFDNRWSSRPRHRTFSRLSAVHIRSASRCLDTLVASASKLCRAEIASHYRFAKEEGSSCRQRWFVAKVQRAFGSAIRNPSTEGAVVGRVVLAGRTVTNRGRSGRIQNVDFYRVERGSAKLAQLWASRCCEREDPIGAFALARHEVARSLTSKSSWWKHLPIRQSSPLRTRGC